MNRLRPIPCSVEDILLLRFFYQYSTARPTKELGHWIVNVLHSLLRLQNQSAVIPMAENLLNFIKEIHALFDKFDITECVAAAIDIGLSSQLGIIPFTFPLHILAEDMPDLFLDLLIHRFGKGWHNDHVASFMALLRTPSVVRFRSYVLRQAVSSVKQIQSFLIQDRLNIEVHLPFHFSSLLPHQLFKSSMNHRLKSVNFTNFLFNFSNIYNKTELNQFNANQLFNVDLQPFCYH
jgi:hypothetical protein